MRGVLQIISNSVDAAWEIWMWIVFFGGTALAMTWIYRGTQELWAAIVGYIAGALTLLLLAVEVVRPDDVFIPTLVMVLIAIPFVFAWNRNRQQWGLLVPAYVMVAIIPILFLGDSPNQDSLIPAYVLGVIGVPFVIAYFFQRKWPLLIPGGIMLVLALFFLLDAVETFAPLLNAALALGLIGGGLYMLLRAPSGSDEDALKPKREN